MSIGTKTAVFDQLEAVGRDLRRAGTAVAVFEGRVEAAARHATAKERRRDVNAQGGPFLANESPNGRESSEDIGDGSLKGDDSGSGSGTPGPGVYDPDFRAVGKAARAAFFGSAPRNGPFGNGGGGDGDGGSGGTTSLLKARRERVEQEGGDLRGVAEAAVETLLGDGGGRPTELDLSAAYALVKERKPTTVFAKAERGGDAASRKVVDGEERGSLKNGPGLKYSTLDGNAVVKKKTPAHSFGPGFGKPVQRRVAAASTGGAGSPPTRAKGSSAGTGAVGSPESSERVPQPDREAIDKAYSRVLESSKKAVIGTAKRVSLAQEPAYQSDVVLHVEKGLAITKKRVVGGAWGRQQRSVSATVAPDAGTGSTQHAREGEATEQQQNATGSATKGSRVQGGVINPPHRPSNVVQAKRAREQQLAPGPGQYDTSRPLAHHRSRATKIAPEHRNRPPDGMTLTFEEILQGVEDGPSAEEAILQMRSLVRSGRARGRLKEVPKVLGPGQYDHQRGEKVVRKRAPGAVIAPLPSHKRRLTDFEVKRQLEQREAEAQRASERVGERLQKANEKRGFKLNESKMRESSDLNDSKLEQDSKDADSGKRSETSYGSDAGGGKASDRGDGKHEDVSDSSIDDEETKHQAASSTTVRRGKRKRAVALDPSKLTWQPEPGDPNVDFVRKRTTSALIAPHSSLKDRRLKAVKVNRMRKQRAATIGFHDVRYGVVEPRVAGIVPLAAAINSQKKTAAAAAIKKINRLLARFKQHGGFKRTPDYVGKSAPADWADRDLGRKNMVPWRKDEDGISFAIKRRKEALEARRRDWLPSQVHQSIGDDDSARKALQMELHRGRDKVVVRDDGSTAVVPFSGAPPDDPTGPDLGPGRYATEDPELDVQFRGHKRAVAVSFGPDKRTGRADAVGPFGNRPQAALDAELEEEGAAQGDVLSLSPGIGRPDDPSVPSFSFARATRTDEHDDTQDDEGQKLILDPNRADKFVRPEVPGYRFVKIANQMGRTDGKRTDDDEAEGDKLVLDVNKAVADPHVPGVAFGRQAGSRLGDDDAHDDDGNVLLLDVDKADKKRRKNVGGIVEMSKLPPRWIDDDDTSDVDNYKQAEYDVETALRKVRNDLGIGVVPFDKQPERWQDDPEGGDEREHPGGLILEPNFDVGRPRRGGEAGLVPMDKQRDRWVDVDVDVDAASHVPDGDILELDPTEDYLSKRRRVPAGVSMDKQKDRWHDRDGADGESGDEQRLILEPHKADRITRKRAPVLVDLSTQRGRHDDSKSTEAGVAVWEASDIEGDNLQLSPKVAALSTNKRTMGARSMGLTTGRSGRTAVSEVEAVLKRKKERREQQRQRRVGRRQQTGPEVGDGSGGAEAAMADPDATSGSSLAPPERAKSPQLHHRSRSRSRTQTQRESATSTDTLTKPRSVCLVSFSKSRGRDDISSWAAPDSPREGDVLQLSPRDDTLRSRVKHGPVMRPPTSRRSKNER